MAVCAGELARPRTPLLEWYTIRPNGAFTRWQESAALWCYYDADPDFGRFQARHLTEALRDRLSIEDPFETHDSPNPNRRHDVARSLASQKGKAAHLGAEWERARDILADRSSGKQARVQVARLFARAW